MYYYRISKYNPKLRNNSGQYMLEDWTSYSDIGKVFLGIELKFDTYEQVENSYIDFILSVMKETNTKFLEIEELEKYDDTADIFKLNPKYDQLFQELDNNRLIGVNEVLTLLRLQLRDYIWTKLISEALTIHFGYDYYMYIISKKKLNEFCNESLKKTIYVEENYKSPSLN